ncbi:hypothetical protein ACA910_012442 [Epithemia clementina (nom. ined.)]
MQQWSLRCTAQDQPAPPPSSLQPSPINYASIVTAVIQTLKTRNLIPQPTEALTSTSISATTLSGLQTSTESTLPAAARATAHTHVDMSLAADLSQIDHDDGN